MRTFEILTLIATFFTLVALATEKQRKIFLNILFLATMSAIAQYYIEGLRWQFFPALYLLPIIYISYKYHKGVLNRISKILLSIWFLIAIFLPWAVPVFSLPHPGGPFNVGTEVFHWTDSSRLEWFTKEENDRREIMVQLWYPSKNKENFNSEPYLDFIRIRSKTIAAAGGIPVFLPSHLELIKTNSYKKLECPKQKNTFPVLIFSHGITGSRHLHQVLFEYLASRGYVVIAPDHSFDANLTIFPDQHIADYRSNITGHPDSINIRKKQINTRIKDISFIIDQLEKIHSGNIASMLNESLNLDKIAVGGHSYGGATATYATYKDNRIKACFALDGWINPVPEFVIKSGLKVPFLYIGRPSWKESDYPDNYIILKNLVNQSSNAKYNLIIQNTLHLDYTDIPLFSPFMKYAMDVGSLSSDISSPLVNTLVFGFLEKHIVEKKNNKFNAILKNELVINL